MNKNRQGLKLVNAMQEIKGRRYSSGGDGQSPGLVFFPV